MTIIGAAANVIVSETSASIPLCKPEFSVFFSLNFKPSFLQAKTALSQKRNKAVFRLLFSMWVFGGGSQENRFLRVLRGCAG